jgi:hypothetical protein
MTTHGRVMMVFEQIHLWQFQKTTSQKRGSVAGDHPILPFNHDIVAGAVSIFILLCQGTLVCHDALKLPDDALPIFLKRVEEIIV